MPLPLPLPGSAPYALPCPLALSGSGSATGRAPRSGRRSRRSARSPVRRRDRARRPAVDRALCRRGMLSLRLAAAIRGRGARRRAWLAAVRCGDALGVDRRWSDPGVARPRAGAPPRGRVAAISRVDEVGVAGRRGLVAARLGPLPVTVGAAAGVATTATAAGAAGAVAGGALGAGARGVVRRALARWLRSRRSIMRALAAERGRPLPAGRAPAPAVAAVRVAVEPRRPMPTARGREPLGRRGHRRRNRSRTRRRRPPAAPAIRPRRRHRRTSRRSGRRSPRRTATARRRRSGRSRSGFRRRERRGFGAPPRGRPEPPELEIDRFPADVWPFMPAQRAQTTTRPRGAPTSARAPQA